MKPTIHKGHYWCDKCEDVSFHPTCCGRPCRWVSHLESPSASKAKSPIVASRKAHKLFAEMRDIVAATPDAFAK